MYDGNARQLLSEEMNYFISLLPEEMGCYAREPLTVSRRALSVTDEHEPPWILLPAVVCGAICGISEKAIPICASLQFFMAAGDVFDDIEDNDSPLSLCSKYGTAITNNIATTLLVLGEKAIARLKDRDIEEKTIVRILETINSYYLTACAGQHLDLSCGNKINISEDDYLRILSLKSASQIECACYTGSILATDNKEIHDIFKEFGYNLGMMAQIINDISGIINEKDLLNKKITLPVIFALSQTEDANHKQLRDYYINRLYSTIGEEQTLKILSDTGAIHYTAIKLESYKIYASDALDKADRAGINTKRLRDFLK
jgi:geranylgeranyl pyrophosphate synthase